MCLSVARKIVFIFFLPVFAVALGLFLLTLAWSGYSLYQSARLGGSIVAAFHILFGSVVLVHSFDKYYDHYSSWSCRGFMLNCYPEAAIGFVLMGLLPCGFAITGHLLRLALRSKR